jgi:hypothetical protein
LSSRFIGIKDSTMYINIVNAKPIIPHNDRNVIALIMSRSGFSFPLTLRLFSLNENMGTSETINNDRVTTKTNVNNQSTLLATEIFWTP